MLEIVRRWRQKNDHKYVFVDSLVWMSLATTCNVRRPIRSTEKCCPRRRRFVSSVKTANRKIRWKISVSLHRGVSACGRATVRSGCIMVGPIYRSSFSMQRVDATRIRKRAEGKGKGRFVAIHDEGSELACGRFRNSNLPGQEFG